MPLRLRVWLVNGLKRLVVWLEPYALDAVQVRASALVQWADAAIPGASWKEKREEVRRRLQKEFPDHKLHRLLFVIEEAVQREKA